MEIHHGGRSLPYTIHDEYPDITPGDIVETKRVAEVISLVQAAQKNGDGQLSLRNGSPCERSLPCR